MEKKKFYNYSLEDKYFLSNLKILSSEKERYLKFKRKLIELRRIEYNKENMVEIQKILDAVSFCYQVLVGNNLQNLVSNLIGYNRYFEELNEVISFYNLKLNDFVKEKYKNDNYTYIFVNKHHHCVNKIIHDISGNELPTVIFLDNHADVNVPNVIANEEREYIDYIGIFDELKSNCGSVHIPLIMNYISNNGIIWIHPEESNVNQLENCLIGLGTDNLKFNLIDNNSFKILSKNIDSSCNNVFFNKFFEFKDRGEFYKTTRCKEWIKNQNTEHIDCYYIENEVVKKEIFVNSKTKLDVMSIDNFTNFKKVTEKYILNIDLDYFISMGSETENFKDINDEEQALMNVYYIDETTNNFFAIDFQFARKNGGYNEYCCNRLEKTLNDIRYRIDKLLNMINELKIIGKTPSTIVICDSSELFLSENSNNCVYGKDGFDFDFNLDFNDFNCFMPNYLVFWLKNTVCSHIDLILRN